MRVAVIGAGAVGCYYGGLLQRAGNEVHYLFHHDAAVWKQRGLTIDSRDGRIHLPTINAHSDAATVPPSDLVLVTLKTTQNQHLGSLLARAVGAGSTVLVLQNGLDVEADVAAVAPKARVLGGLCFLCASRVEPGTIRHLAHGQMTLGDHRPTGQPPGISGRCTQIADLLVQAGVVASCLDDLVGARWRKLCWNIPFNGLSVVLDAGTDVLMADPATRRLAHSIMKEVQAGAAALGHAIPEPLIDKMLNDTDSMGAYRTSMKLDYDAGRELELAAIYERPLAAVAKLGRSMPRTEMLWRQVRHLAQRAAVAHGQPAQRSATSNA